MSENNEWFLGDTLKDPGLIAEFEQHVGYRLPEDFKVFVVEHNGCYAENELFYSYCRGKKIEQLYRVCRGHVCRRKIARTHLPERRHDPEKEYNERPAQPTKGEHDDS